VHAHAQHDDRSMTMGTATRTSAAAPARLRHDGVARPFFVFPRLGPTIALFVDRFAALVLNIGLVSSFGENDRSTSDGAVRVLRVAKADPRRQCRSRDGCCSRCRPCEG